MVGWQVRTVSFRACDLLASASKPASSFRWVWDYSIPMIRNLNDFNDQQSPRVLGPYIYMYIYIIYIYQDTLPSDHQLLANCLVRNDSKPLRLKIPLRLSQSCCNPPKAWDLCNMMVLTQRVFCQFSARKTQAEDEKQVTPTGQGPRNMRHKSDEVRVITNPKLVRPGSALWLLLFNTSSRLIWTILLKYCCKPSYDH